MHKIWKGPNIENFVEGLVLSGFSSFLFGWHVHEKAILMVLIPFSLLIYQSEKHYKLAIIASLAGYASLLPLLFNIQETILKCSALLIYMLFMVGQSQITNGFKPIEIAYAVGYIPLLLYTEVFSKIWAIEQYEFLPLMCISVYSAFGISYAWVSLYYISIF